MSALLEHELTDAVLSDAVTNVKASSRTEYDCHD